MLLQSLDSHWREHLAAMDHLRQGIHLRGYAAKNPKQEYKREAFELFERMLETIAHEITQVTMTVQIRSEADVEAVEPQENLSNVRYQHADYDTALAPDADAEVAPGQQPIERQYAKVGRNDLCPCGSGKKYKHCHGKLA
jgi:preprotein translocase subunit SecA